jgi:hypothetical protein
VDGDLSARVSPTRNMKENNYFGEGAGGKIGRKSPQLVVLSH